jgi:hypothetical protein
VTLAVSGSAALRYRVSIDTSPYDAVTHDEMTATGSLGVAARSNGLKLLGQKLVVNCDPIACTLNAGSLTIKFVDIDRVWSTLFDREPPNITWLDANCNATDTTITVASTAGFSSTGTIWIDSEAITYTGVTATTFTGCTRGAYSDDADAATYHYVTDGSRRRSPEVTDWPVSWEQRRVRLFRYEETDLASGDGTQCYLGTISTAPSFDGKEWSVSVTSIAGILDQTLGADLSEAVYPSGISYSEAYPLRFGIRESSTNGPGGSPAEVYLVGHFVDQNEFVEALQVAIDAAQTAFSHQQRVVAIADGNAGWHMEFTTLPGALDRLWMGISNGPTGTVSACDSSFGGIEGGPQNEDGSTEVGVDSATRYYFWQGGIAPVAAGSPPSTSAPAAGLPGAGSVPRGVFDISDGYARSRTLYLGGSAPISSLIDAVLVDWGGDFTDDQFEVTSYSATTRSMTFAQQALAAPAGTPRPGSRAFTSMNMPTIRFGLMLCSSRDGVASDDFMATIVSRQQECSTLGVVPMLRAGDYDAAGWTAAAATAQPPLVTKRLYMTFAPVSIGDIVREELKLAGCILSIDASGRIVPQRLRLAAASELSSRASIDSSSLLTDERLLSHEVAGLGQVNQVLLKTGYNAAEDEHQGRTWITRDVAAFGRSPSVRQTSIEPKSVYVGPEITEDVVVECASGILGCFAGQYAVDVIDAALQTGTLVGDVVLVTNPHVPSGNGGMGVTLQPAFVIATSQGVYSPRCTLTVLTTRQKVGGYAPAADITGDVDKGDDLWAVDVDDGTFPSGTVASDWFAVGDRVRVIEANTASATVVVGTVTDTFDASVEVQFDGVWGGSGSGTTWWYLTMADSDDASLAATQKRFCSIGGAEGIVDYASADAPAFRFGA